LITWHWCSCTCCFLCPLLSFIFVLCSFLRCFFCLTLSFSCFMLFFNQLLSFFLCLLLGQFFFIPYFLILFKLLCGYLGIIHGCPFFISGHLVIWNNRSRNDSWSWCNHWWRNSLFGACFLIWILITRLRKSTWSHTIWCWCLRFSTFNLVRILIARYTSWCFDRSCNWFLCASDLIWINIARNFVRSRSS
jgi:hypothetical protein